jgi:ribulose-5-phosphate 4-epimerase/fuculose-1-phosphate aldolase
MVSADLMKQKWIKTRERLVAKGLLADAGATLSVRCPAAGTMWLGAVVDGAPVLVEWRGATASGAAAVHAGVYAHRPDVGAIAWSGGPFGGRLVGFGGVMPQVFDEQARHLGPMSPAIESETGIAPALRSGGNALVCRGRPLCLGVTPPRLALNVELFEKCAKAYVLAVATGGHVKQLPWLVRRIANSRLFKDERRAADAYARGELPEESRAY